MSASTDKAVRKAVLQAHAEIERIELAQRVADVRTAVSPKNLINQVLPVASQGSSGSGFLSRFGWQMSNHPALLSAAAFLLRKGRAGQLVKVATAALAMRKAMKMIRR